MAALILGVVLGLKEFRGGFRPLQCSIGLDSRSAAWNIPNNIDGIIVGQLSSHG